MSEYVPSGRFDREAGRFSARRDRPIWQALMIHRCAWFALLSLALENKSTPSQIARFLGFLRIRLRLAGCSELFYDSTQLRYPPIAGLRLPTCWDTNSTCNLCLFSCHPCQFSMTLHVVLTNTSFVRPFINSDLVLVTLPHFVRTSRAIPIRFDLALALGRKKRAAFLKIGGRVSINAEGPGWLDGRSE